MYIYFYYILIPVNIDKILRHWLTVLAARRYIDFFLHLKNPVFFLSLNNSAILWGSVLIGEGNCNLSCNWVILS